MSAGILTDQAIQLAVDAGDIVVDPFDPGLLNPTSYDVRLGEMVSVYDVGRSTLGIHDVKDAPDKMRHAVIGPAGFVIHPGKGYLMHTLERVATRRYVPVLDGKSSIGRLFISIHQTAGYGDPGFDGQYTLEVTTHHFPVRLYAGMRIAQIRFHTMVGELARPYAGNYVGEGAKGPVPSRAWRQFR